MRLREALIAAVLSCLALAAPAAADGYSRAPAGWGEVQTVRHYGYYPRYRNIYATAYATDPYAYGGRYVQPGDYPYYNSGYWRPGLMYRRGAFIGRGYYLRRGYPYGAWAAARWGSAYRPY